jgi:non-heme chloroperoxidase
MSTITKQDPTQIIYLTAEQPLVFNHRWPLITEALEDQTSHLASHGYRFIAFDQLGRGDSSHPRNNNDLDTHADGLAELVQRLGSLVTILGVFVSVEGGLEQTGAPKAP